MATPTTDLSHSSASASVAMASICSRALEAVRNQNDQGLQHLEIEITKAMQESYLTEQQREELSKYVELIHDYKVFRVLETNQAGVNKDGIEDLLLRAPPILHCSWLNNYAVTLAQEGHTEESLVFLARARHASPSDTDVEINTCILLLVIGNNEAASKAFESIQTIKKGSDSKLAQLQRHFDILNNKTRDDCNNTVSEPVHQRSVSHLTTQPCDEQELVAIVNLTDDDSTNRFNESTVVPVLDLRTDMVTTEVPEVFMVTTEVHEEIKTIEPLNEPIVEPVGDATADVVLTEIPEACMVTTEEVHHEESKNIEPLIEPTSEPVADVSADVVLTEVLEARMDIAEVHEETKKVDIEPKRQYYDIKQLVSPGPYPSGVDAQKREDYLTDTDFESVFGTKRKSFESLPKWRQIQLKKNVAFF